MLTMIAFMYLGVSREEPLETSSVSMQALGSCGLSALGRSPCSDPCPQAWFPRGWSGGWEFFSENCCEDLFENHCEKRICPAGTVP